MVICRDCLHQAEGGPAERCPSCGSPRLLADPGPALAIAHVDCDAFYAAIEKRDDPALRDKPVIVGGGRRGVVTTACYVARIDGVRSAMPMFKALEACPDAVVIRPNMEKYAAVGREVRRLMGDLTPAVQPVSIDEAYLDLSGTERVHAASPALTLLRFARRVETEIGITVSIGLAPNKFLAKIASDLDKPRGFTVIRREEALAFLADRPVGIIPGIGAAAQERLARAGVTLIRHLSERPAVELVPLVGRDAERLRRLAGGEDARPVGAGRDAKGVSAETTLNADLSAFADLQPVLWRLSERVAGRLKRSGLAGRSVTLKLKDRAFRLRTRARSGLPPTQLATRLYEAALPLLRAECDGTPFRLDRDRGLRPLRRRGRRPGRPRRQRRAPRRPARGGDRQASRALRAGRRPAGPHPA
jgi:DNA polymerase-4